MDAPFEYSAHFRALIERLHRGHEDSPRYRGEVNAHLGGPESHLFRARSRLVREIEIRCGSLLGRRVLDVGCGTGATTAALAEASRDVVAFDVKDDNLSIAQARVQEHGRADHVRFACAPSVDKLGSDVGTFNVIVLNSVLERIPRSRPHAREDLLKAAFALLRPGGYLFVNDTPNRLWPRDGRVTGLPLLPWTPAGSRIAYQLALALRRHADAPGRTRGPGGLEESGAWGATYWEIASALDGTGAACMNLLPGQDQRVSYAARSTLSRRRLERTLYIPAVKVLRAPITAFLPSLTNLVFKKPGSVT